jgi:hypothetical protein
MILIKIISGHTQTLLRRDLSSNLQVGHLRCQHRNLRCRVPESLKRSENHTLGWLNKHFDAIKQILPQFFFEDNQERVVGSMAEHYMAGKAINPDRPTCVNMASNRSKTSVFR